MQTIDVSTMPELARLAQEVKRSQQPLVLTRDDEEVAVLVPAGATRWRGWRKRKSLTADDPIWDIVGMSEAEEGPTDVAEHKYRYLAEAYAPQQT